MIYNHDHDETRINVEKLTQIILKDEILLRLEARFVLLEMR